MGPQKEQLIVIPAETPRLWQCLSAQLTQLSSLGGLGAVAEPPEQEVQVLAHRRLPPRRGVTLCR